MPVALPLNENQMAVYEQAVKGKNLTIKVQGRSLMLTRENHAVVRDAVTKLHEKKLKVRSKTIEHMETCFFAQQIIEQLDRVCVEFTNDNTVGLVSDATILPVPSPEEPEAEAEDFDAPDGTFFISSDELDSALRSSSGDTRDDAE